MLCNLASGEHVGLVGSEEDLSCLHLNLSGLLGEMLSLRAKRDEAKPKDATSDLNVEPVGHGPGREGRLRVGCCVLACPPVVLCPPIVLRQGNEVSTCIEETLVASFTVSAGCGTGCGLLLVAVCDENAQQCSDDGNSGRNDPQHNDQPISGQRAAGRARIGHRSPAPRSPTPRSCLCPLTVHFSGVRGRPWSKFNGIGQGVRQNMWQGKV